VERGSVELGKWKAIFTVDLTDHRSTASIKRIGKNRDCHAPHRDGARNGASNARNGASNEKKNNAVEM